MKQRFFNLRVKLLEHDMTQEEAAKIAGISPSAMVNRMSGKYPFDAWEMQRLAKALDIAPADYGKYFFLGVSA